MYYILYIDRLFFLNFYMNLLVLSLVKLSLKRTVTRFRMILSAFLGAVGYIAVIFLPPVSYQIKVILGFTSISIFMLFVMYPKSGLSFLIKALLHMYGFTFLLGGVLLFIKKYSAFKGDSAWLYILLPAAVIYFVLCFLLKRRQEAVKECKVTLSCEEKQLVLRAFVDSGNMLVEPISGKPVSVIEARRLGEEGIVLREEKCKVIPYHSVGKKNGILIGYEFPQMVLHMEKEDRKVDRVIIAVSQDSLFRSGKYEMLLHPELLEGKV